MKELSVYEPYWSGARFSDAYYFDFSSRSYKKRIDVIKNIVSAKKDCKVIHFGACDNFDNIDKKLKNGTWLHKVLTDHTLQTIGIDINQKAVDYCRQIGWDNMICVDIEKDDRSIREILRGGVTYDYLVMGEMLEHVDNPVKFLETVNATFQGRCQKVIITVPNALSIFNFFTALKGCEANNTDHRYTFTPYTLCHVVYRAGMMPEKMVYAETYGNRIAQALRKIYKKNICGDRLVLVARLGRN